MKKKAHSKLRRQNKRDDNVVLLKADQLARSEGPQKKKWSIHDLRPIQPLTDTQADMFQSWFQGDNVCAYGSAGTGKTFLATYLAIDEFLSGGEHEKVIIIRSAVASRDQGFLPGTKEEKEAVFEIPYKDIFQNLFGKYSTYKDMKEARILEFMTTSHIRGLTWDNTIVIVDEVQNMSFSEIDSIVTRLGYNSRIIFAGDHKKQCDLKRHEESGIERLVKASEQMSQFSNIKFSYDDVVRSELVKQWLKVTDQT